MISGGAGYFFPMLINFLGTPLLIDKLGKEAFGLQSVVNIILGYLMVADMGLDVPVIKFLAEYSAKNDTSNRNNLLNSSLQIYVIIGLIGMCLILIAHPYLSALFGIPDALRDEARFVFVLTGIGFFANVLTIWGKAVFIGIQRYEIANGIYILTNTVATITGLLLVFSGYGVVAFVSIKIFAFFVSAVAYLLLTKPLLSKYTFSMGIDREIVNKIKPLIGYGFMMRITGMLLSRLDQTFIGLWIGVGAVGVYSIPLLLTTAVTGLIAGVMNYTFPKASELFGSNKIGDLINLFLTSSRHIALLAVYLFCFIIVTGDKFVTLWLGDGLANETTEVLIILSISFLISSLLCGILNNFVIPMNGIKDFTLYTSLRSGVMAIGFAVLIKPFGITGAACGVLIGNIIDMGYFHLATKKYIRVPAFAIIKESYLKPIFLLLIFIPPLLLVRNYMNSWISFFLVGTIYTASFALAALILKAINEKERLLIFNFINKLKG